MAFQIDNIVAMDWFSLVFIISSFIVITREKNEPASVFIMFLALTYLFHFGQSVIRILPIRDIYYNRSILAKTSEKLVGNAQFFADLCVFGMTVGYMFSKLCSRREHRNKRIIHEEDEIRELVRLNRIGLYVLLIAIIPMLYIDYQKIAALANQNYSSTYLVYQQGVGKYLGFIGQFGKPAISLLIYANCKNRRKARTIFTISSIYLVLAMLSGDRGTYLIYIVTNLLILYKYVYKIKTRTIVKGAIIAYIGFAFLSALTIFRYTDLSFDSFVSSLIRRKNEGILYSVLREFGGTVVTLTNSIEYFPSNHGHVFGLTYIVSALYVLPVLPSKLSNAIFPYVSFVRNFPVSAVDYVALGGSYLGELFFNFGWASPLAACFLGHLFYRIDYVMNDQYAIRNKAVIMVLLPSMMLWVRDFYVNMVFKTFWFAILILFVTVKRKK